MAVPCQAFYPKSGLKKSRKTDFIIPEPGMIIKLSRFTAPSNLARLYMPCDGVKMR
jgi:hypothetical protein